MEEYIDFKRDYTFAIIIDKIIASEGGYVNHPRDTGGPTMWGVAWNYNADFLKKMGITAGTMKNLTRDQAKQVYFEKYWLPSGGRGISDTDLAYMHLDAAINCGVGKAKEWLDKLSSNPKNFDGRGGKNRSVFLQLFLEYLALRLSFYTHCRDRDVFLAGWVNRLVKVIADAKDLD